VVQREIHELLEVLLHLNARDKVGLLKPLKLIDPFIDLRLDLARIECVKPTLEPTWKSSAELGGHEPELVKGLEVVLNDSELLKLGFGDCK
jgi:hypothetical protein